jgi:hypothetical protein
MADEYKRSKDSAPKPLKDRELAPMSTEGDQFSNLSAHTHADRATGPRNHIGVSGD